ncbi:leucyl/phenylalanyl-tRNA--protein transferase [Candidatus Macondimonas diazotrophica]|jgi:leucyl/phenylalanyl-tRNA--protein transferase|uniref:Leucyl/phenylalanyl-tRNA--protein transferase n=1 Tax=Candidatus Macondimonas diazotrophica TaxID=2305248 RepID=A0A4Z0FAK0_9GAMM|nr:leucyl/phenylalanyl-tRNA--protein transferase [Candidatus Macondimonas diazotrophica]TFZ83472.1 leucyl/phenylalanyl-tRNA--protein transferase [Candidatus Macondimonas diazotrophica]
MIPMLQPDDPPDHFPDPARALRHPDGLLAFGGDLSAERLVAAYQRGIFPWYNEGDPILWWSPDPRTVLLPAAIHRSRRLERRMRQARYRASIDEAFDPVVHACAEPRGTESGTWLLPEMHAAYSRLHHSQGLAHSIELWDGDHLVGGLYGIALGRVFFGESMFSRVPDASKILLVILGCQLARRDYRLIDAQVASPHLLRMGAQLWPRPRFLQELSRAVTDDPPLPLAPLDPDLSTPGGGLVAARDIEQRCRL